MFAFIANFCLILLLGSLNGHAYSGGYEGDDCSTCHGGPTPGTTTITVNGFGMPNETYIPGDTYQVTVTVSDPNLPSATEGGLYVIVDQGSLAPTDSNLKLVDSGNPTELIHSTDAAVSWSFSWTAPNASDWVTATIAAMVADGSGSGGDFWNSTVLQINAIGSTNTGAPPPPPSKTVENYEGDIIVATVLSTGLLIALLAFFIFVDRIRRRPSD